MSEKSQTPNALAMTVARKILGALVRNAVRGDGVLTDVSLAKEIETLIAGEVSRVREKADKYLAADVLRQQGEGGGAFARDQEGRIIVRDKHNERSDGSYHNARQ